MPRARTGLEAASNAVPKNELDKRRAEYERAKKATKKRKVA
jgi:hypothetical protein